MKKWIALAALTASFSTSYAQIERHFGFKVGLNRADIQTDNPLEGETRKPYTGFQIGATMSWDLTERFGLRAEAVYSRKGGKSSYEGPGFFNFKKADGSRVLAENGTLSMGSNVTHSYIDVPVMATVRLGKIELSAGPSVSLLAGSSAIGELNFSRPSAVGQSAITLPGARRLNYGFFSDKAGEGASDQPDEIVVNGQTVSVDQSLGAYYQLDEKPASLYNRLDFGLNAGLAWFFNDALYISARLNYGLTDTTNDAADLDPRAFDAAKKPVFRSQFDRNVVIQGAVGFSF